MIAKERAIPLMILILEALLRRLPFNHPKKQQINDELSGRRAGYAGELSMDYYYRSLSEKKFYILHDINLPDGDYNCQIDTLILAQEFALVIEVKHMAGKLVFDTENEQFIQHIDGKEKGYNYPIAQAERHKHYIDNFLKDNGFPPLQVEYHVILTNQYCTFAVSGRHSAKVINRVCKSDLFLKRFASYEERYTKEILSQENLHELTMLLINKNTIPTSYALKKYEIDKSECIFGVHCPNCFHLPIARKHQKWYCHICDTYSKDAHMGALQDYFLLKGNKITNREFRVFAQIGSENVAKRLLKSENLLKYGKNKGIYYSPKETFFVKY